MIKWLSYFKKGCENAKKFGEKSNIPLNKEEEITFINSLNKTNYFIENEYINFLRTANGYCFDGLTVLASKNHHDGDYVYIDFIDFNENYREESKEKEIQIYATSGEIIYARNIINGQIIYASFFNNDPTSPNETFKDFNELLSFALKTSQI